MKIFLDANILVSVLNKEYPHFPFSSRVLSLADNRKISVYTYRFCGAIAFILQIQTCPVHNNSL